MATKLAEKPTITILYDADEERVRDQALARGEKFPTLVCNQIEVHPFLDAAKVVAACRRDGMAVVAYSPIARGDARNDPVLTRIGRAHRKSAVQVALRFLVQQGIAVIPRTSKLDRLVENAALFDFALSGAEMTEIGKLARRDGRVVDYSYAGAPSWD